MYLKLMELWMDRLSGHFNIELSESQIEVYLNAMSAHTDYQINTAFERCLNECEFMPKLRDVHSRMPEEPEERKISTFVQKKPIIEVVQPYAQVAAEQLFGKSLEQLEGAARMKAFFYGNRARYESIGIDTSKWPAWDDKMEALIQEMK